MLVKTLSDEAIYMMNNQGAWRKKRSYYILDLGQKGSKKIKQELKGFCNSFGGFSHQNKEYIFPYDPKSCIQHAAQHGYITLMQDNYCHLPLDIARSMAKLVYDNDKPVLVPYSGYGILSNSVQIYNKNVWTSNPDFGDMAEFTASTYNHISIDKIQAKFGYVVMKPPLLASKDMKACIFAFNLLSKNGTLISIINYNTFAGFKGKNKSFDNLMTNLKSYVVIPHDQFTLASPQQDWVLCVFTKE